MSAKKRFGGESFAPVLPCEDEKGSQNDFQIQPKALPNSNMFCTSFSEAFWVHFGFPKPCQNCFRDQLKLFEARWSSASSFFSGNPSQWWPQACKGTTLKFMIFAAIYSSFEEFVLRANRSTQIRNWSERSDFHPKKQPENCKKRYRKQRKWGLPSRMDFSTITTPKILPKTIPIRLWNRRKKRPQKRGWEKDLTLRCNPWRGYRFSAPRPGF